MIEKLVRFTCDNCRIESSTEPEDHFAYLIKSATGEEGRWLIDDEIKVTCPKCIDLKNNLIPTQLVNELKGDLGEYWERWEKTFEKFNPDFTFEWVNSEAIQLTGNHDYAEEGFSEILKWPFTRDDFWNAVKRIDNRRSDWEADMRAIEPDYFEN